MLRAGSGGRDERVDEDEDAQTHQVVAGAVRAIEERQQKDRVTHRVLPQQRVLYTHH